MERLKAKTLSLLRKSETIFKTDMVYLAKGGFWLMLVQVVSAFASFALAVGFAHLISKETYGTYKYIMSVGGLISAFSLSGLSTAVINSVARGGEGALSYAFRKNIIWSIPMLLVFCLVSSYYAFEGNHLLALGLFIFGIITPLLSSASMADSYFIGRKDFKSSAITSSIATIFTYSTTLTVAFFNGTIIGIVLAFMVSSLIGEVVIYIYVIRFRHPNQEIDTAATAYGTHLSVVNVINIIMDRLDSILAFHYFGPAELAIYSFAIAMPEQIKGIVKTASNLSQPKFSAQQSQPDYAPLRNKILLITLVSIPLVLLYIALAPFIYRIFFPQYTGYTVILSQIYSLSLLTAAAILPTTYLQAKTAKKELYLYNLIGGITQIIAMTIGAAIYGLLGLVIAIILSRFFRFFYATYLVRGLHATT